MEDLQRLMSKIEKDPSLQKNLQNSKDKPDLEKRIRSAGFNVTADDFIRALNNRCTNATNKSGTLSDDELGNVAGGGFGSDFWSGFKYGFCHPIDAIGTLLDQI